jgi:hypothetical protein
VFISINGPWRIFDPERRVEIMKLKKHLGFLLLAIWLITGGLLSLLQISIPYADVILALLAIAAGVLIILKAYKIY